MILEVAVAALLAYFAVGVAMCYRGPLARKRKAEAFSTTLMVAFGGKKMPVRLFAFRAAMLLGIVLLWPVFWLDNRRGTRVGSRASPPIRGDGP